MHFMPYQTRFINDESRLKILVKSRRIGGTFAVSYMVFKRMMKTRNHDITVVTRDERLAVEFVTSVKRWFQLWNLTRTDPNEIIPDKAFKRLEIEIPHAEGATRLIAVSSNPDAVIGKGGDLILDEFAAHKDPDLLWSLAQPVIMAGGSCTILSTQRGRESLFNKLVEEAQEEGSEWSLHRTTLEDAVADGLVEFIVNPTLKKLGNETFESGEAFIAWIKRTVDEHTYNQEYMTIASEDSTVLLTRQELKNSFQKLLEEGSLENGVNYMGWDIAESEVGDFATFSVIRSCGEQIELIHSEYIPKGTSIDDQLDIAKRLNKEYNPIKIVCDSNGIGRYPCAVLQKKLGSKVIAFESTLKSKADMYTKLKRFFENDKVRMMEDDAIETDFLSISRIITPSNNIVYSASRINGSHGDMASSFAMALTEVPEVFNATITGISSKPSPHVDENTSTREMSIHDRIARNRKLDEKEKRKRKFTM